MARQIRRQVKGSSRAGVGACVRAGGLRGWERAPATTPTLNANVSASLAHPAPRSYRQMPGLRYWLALGILALQIFRVSIVSNGFPWKSTS